MAFFTEEMTASGTWIVDSRSTSNMKNNQNYLQRTKKINLVIGAA